LASLVIAIAVSENCPEVVFNGRWLLLRCVGGGVVALAGLALSGSFVSVGRAGSLWETDGRVTAALALRAELDAAPLS
jgi:hypothetical protein